MPWYKDKQSVLDRVEVYLKYRVTYEKKVPGYPALQTTCVDTSWLLNDTQFVESVLLLADSVYEEPSFWKGFVPFLKGMLKCEQLMKETWNEVNLKQIKKYRPDIYKQWAEGTI